MPSPAATRRPRRPRRTRAALGAVLCAVAAPCAALSPRTGDYAMTAAAGIAQAPGEDDLHARAGASLTVDFHWTARNSLRAAVGFLSLPARGGSGRGDVSALFLTANASHNWIGRDLFPYVTGGLGVYALEEGRGAGEDTDRWEVGLNGGVGLEARFTDTLTLRVEGTLHALTGSGPSTVAVGSVGLKFYY